jgi:hypothetical protein
MGQGCMMDWMVVRIGKELLSSRIALLNIILHTTYSELGNGVRVMIS